MKVFFMRHGQTNYNLLHLCNDDPRDDVHLTGTGREQARAAAERLKHAAIEHIYVSPLPRTRETAEIVADRIEARGAGQGWPACGFNRRHRAPITEHPGLHDIRSGCNGRPVAEYFAAIAHNPLHGRVNGGESLIEHKGRVLGFLAWLRGQPHRTVLVVAHEETLRVFDAAFRGLPDEALRSLWYANGEILAYEL